MKKIVFLMIFLFGMSFGNKIIVMPVSPEPIAIKSNGEKAISIESMIIKTEIKGNIATTTYELTFFNPNNRVLEGEFEFPLLDGQSVVSYALEINGKMRAGVVVDKEKARKTFETIERQNVDPGILEKTKGNNYKTRIYPIPANGYKKVIIGYEEILPKEKDRLQYYLPLNYKSIVKNFSLEIKVPEQKIKPEFINKISGINFDDMATGYYAKNEKKNYKPNESIKFSILAENTEKVYTQEKENNTYFLATVPSASKDPINPLRDLEKQRKITLIWDTSNSGINRSKEKEMEFLDSYIKYLGNTEISLVTFNNKVSSIQVFDIKSGNWSRLKEKLNNIQYDGETRFQDLDLNKYKSDEIILVTDGLLSYGKERIKLSKTPIITINSSKSSDEGYLRSISAKTNGKYIDLNREDTEKAMENIKHENYRLISYTYDKNIISEIYPPVSENIAENFSFTGVVKNNKKAEITVNFGYGNIISETRKVLVGKTAQSEGIDRVWASKKIEYLNGDYENNKEEIIRTAKDYSIVTDDTTLIVLDRIEDYVRYEIVPPVELREEYDKQTANKKKVKEDTEKKSIDESVYVLGNIKKWYVKEFSKDKPKNEGNIYNKKGNLQNNYSSIQSNMTGESAGIEMLASEGSYVREESFSDSMELNKTVITSGKGGGFNIKGGFDSKISNPTIKVKAWSPDEPYLKELDKVSKSKLMDKYYEIKKDYAEQPSFYIDVADYLMKKGMYDDAEQVLSNISELKLESPELLKSYGYKLLELKKYNNAIEVFTELVKIKGEDPQSYRDLAMTYERAGKYQEALDTYYNILTKTWDSRFYSVKDVVLKEMNRLISINKNLNLSNIDKRLIYAMPLDVRVVLDWTVDNSDIDLHFVDSYEEEGYYGNKLTRIGSRLSGDITQGFGPEEFALKDAVKGKYIAKVKYFGDSRQNLAGPITLRVIMYTNYGKKNEKMEEIMVRVKDKKEMLEIGELFFSK